MGQKINPIGFRLAVNRNWRSRWFASKKDFPEMLHSDLLVRKFLKAKLMQAAVSKIVIERAWNSVRVTVHTARPGVVIGRKGQEIEQITGEISRMTGGKSVKIDIVEIKQPELDAQLVAENLAMQIERRISFRRAMKKAVQTTMEMGALGIKVRCSGRLGGAEIARAEWYREGKIPLQTLREPIDYGFAEANTVAGKIGIKCWICKDEAALAAAANTRREDRPARADRSGRGDRAGRGPRGDRAQAPAEAAAAPAPETEAAAPSAV
jgi:small subunit ribosomal protein S3